MPVTKPTILPRWAVDLLGNLSDKVRNPLAGKQDTGFSASEKPPAGWLNFLHAHTYKWLEWLQDIENQALTWTATHTFSGLVKLAGSVEWASVLSDLRELSPGEVRKIAEFNNSNFNNQFLRVYIGDIAFAESPNGIVLTENAEHKTVSGVTGWFGSSGFLSSSCVVFNHNQVSIYRCKTFGTNGLITWSRYVSIESDYLRVEKWSTGTVGNVTMPNGNRPFFGEAWIAAGQRTVTITNALVGPTSTVLPFLQADDGTLRSVNAVVGTGTFTINGNANATANTRVGFLIFSAA